MTTLLQHAFDKAAQLPPDEQDLLAARLLAELAAEDDFDQAIARSSDKLAHLAQDALAGTPAGLTQELDPTDYELAHHTTVPRPVRGPAGPRPPAGA